MSARQWESCGVARKFLEWEWSAGGILVRVSGEAKAEGPAEGISLYDAKSPTLTVVPAVNADMEPDSESRRREIRPSGLMRGEVAARH